MSAMNETTPPVEKPTTPENPDIGYDDTPIR